MNSLLMPLLMLSPPTSSKSFVGSIGEFVGWRSFDFVDVDLVVVVESDSEFTFELIFGFCVLVLDV